MLYQQHPLTVPHNTILAANRPALLQNPTSLHVDTAAMPSPQKGEFNPSNIQPSLLRGFTHKNSAFQPLPASMMSGAEDVLKSSWLLNSSPGVGALNQLFEPGVVPAAGLVYPPSLPSLHLNMSAWMQMRQQLAALLLYQQQESMKSNQEDQLPTNRYSELWSPNFSTIIPHMNAKMGYHLPPINNTSDAHSNLTELTINTQEPAMDAKGVQTNFKEDPGYDESGVTNISTAASSHTNASSPEKKRRKSIFQDGVTVGYTIDAFFVSDGRSRRHSSNPNRRSSNSPPSYVAAPIRQRYTCTECGKDYATSSNLSRHKQTHRSLDSKLAKTCPHCDKVYVSMPALSMHILTHDLKHSCDICGKAFSRPWLLQGHRRAHTGEKPYGCAHCGRAFADRSNLRAHMQTHSIGKNFDCKQCGKNFSLKSYLTKHLESSGCMDASHSTTSSSEETQINL